MTTLVLMIKCIKYYYSLFIIYLFEINTITDIEGIEYSSLFKTSLIDFISGVFFIGSILLIIEQGCIC